MQPSLLQRRWAGRLQQGGQQAPSAAAAAAAAADGGGAPLQLAPLAVGQFGLEMLASATSSPCSMDAVAAKQQACEDAFLCITVHEARHLVPKDFDTHSSDPYVRISLRGTTKKTRVIYRNTNPLWEQRLLFSLSGLSEDEPLLVELFDRDGPRGKEFLGQVVMTLGKALDIAQTAALRQDYWFALSKKRSADIVGGELSLGFELMDAVTYALVCADVEMETDAEHITSTFASKALRVQLKGINGLRASGLLTSRVAPKGLSLLIKVGRCLVEKPLPLLGPEDDAGGNGHSTLDEFELAVHEEVLIPLGPALRPNALKARKRDELLDVKLYIRAQSSETTIAKTQIPIYSIPLAMPDSNPDSLAAAGAAGDAAAGGGVSKGAAAPAAAPAAPAAAAAEAKVQPQPRACGSPEPACSRLLEASGARSSMDSAGDVGESPASTPRGTSEFLLAAVRAESTTSSLSPCASPVGHRAELALRSKSEAALVLGARRAASSTAAACAFVEGSLSSVAASSRALGSPAGVGRRKAQGLAEFNDSFKSAFKSMLREKSEVSRVGWAPTPTRPTTAEAHTGAGMQLPAHDGKCYCRTLESHVHLLCNLEVGLALQIVPAPAAGLPGDTRVPMQQLAAGSTADNDGDDDDDEEGGAASEAEPVLLPPPFDLVLLDAVLGVSVGRLHSLLLGPRSPLMAAHYAAEQLSEVVVGPWQAVPPPAGALRVRQVSYTKKLSIPVPLAPKQCHVWETHELLVKESGGFVATISCTNDAPKGDCFVARVQLCGVHVSPGSSRLRVSLKLDWHKSTLGKGLVQTGAEADAQRGWAALVARLRQQQASTAAAGLPQPAAAAAAAAALATISKQQHASSHSSAQQQLRVVAIALLVAVVLLLLALLLAVWGGTRSIAHELQALTSALQQAAAAGHAGICSNPAGLRAEAVLHQQ